MQGKIIILGKPNVGKSSLFNRLLKDKIAITSDIEGTTRDINIRPLVLGEGENALNIELCDSAGLVKKANGIFKNVKKMIFDFINDGDLILYVVSAGNALDDEDLRLFRSLKNAILVVNKIDIEKNERWEYNAFGAEKIFYVSSLHNRGIKQLRDFLTLWVGNSSLGMQFRTCEKFWESTDSSLVLSQNFSQIQKPHRKILEFEDSNTNDSSDSNNFCDSKNDSNKSARSATSKSVVGGGGGSCEGGARGATSQFKPPPPPSKETRDRRLGEFNADLSAKSRKAIDSRESKKLQILDSSPTAQNDNRDCAESNNTIKIGIIGRVNVGKSSILNALLNKERSLVSEIEGTTIDPVSDEIIYKDKILRFVDTAGIRRASKIEGIEKFALTRTKRILEQSNIVLLVLDSSSDFVELDEKISGLSQKYNLGIILLLNKWDIKCADFKAFSENIKRKFAYLSYAPILTISALKMRHIDEIKATILRVWENFNRRIPTALLNSYIKTATQKHPLPSDRGKIVKVYYALQVDCAPPQILLVMNRPRALHFSYKRYLVNYFRSNFDFSGVPIVILSKGRGKDEVAE